MKRKRLTPGKLLAILSIVTAGFAAILLCAYRNDLFMIGYLIGPFLVVFAPWFLVALGLFLFFPNRPEPSTGVKTKTKADPLDL